jgi:hypothetical protein
LGHKLDGEIECPKRGAKRHPNSVGTIEAGECLHGPLHRCCVGGATARDRLSYGLLRGDDCELSHARHSAPAVGIDGRRRSKVADATVALPRRLRSCRPDAGEQS